MMNRRSTMGGSIRPSEAGSVAGRRQDDRNLKNPEVRREHIDTLDRFFRANCPGIQISNRAFQEPTAKDFVVMWEEITRCLCLQPTDKKLEDRVVETLKLLKYPFQLSKSSLGAPGATNSWPSIRATLVWLIDIVHAYQGMSMRGERSLDGPQWPPDEANKKSTRKYLQSMYVAFMDMDDIEQGRLQAERTEDYNARIQADEKLIAELSAEDETNKERIEEYGARKSRKAEMEQKIRESARDKKLLEEKVQQNEGLIAHTKRRNEQKEIDISTIQKNMERAEQEIAEDKARISSQKYTKQEVEELMNKKARSDQNLETLRSKSAAVRQQNNELQGKITEVRYSIGESIHKCNTLGSDLKLIPSSTKRARGIEFSIDIDVSASNSELQLPENIKAEILPTIEELAQQYKRKAQGLQQELGEIEQRLERTKKDVSGLQSDILAKQAELENKQSEIKMIRDARKKTQDEALVEIEAIEKNIIEIQEKTTIELEEALDAMKEAEKEAQASKEKCQKELHKCKTDILRSVERQNAIFAQVQKFVEQHRAECHGVKSDVDKLKEQFKKRSSLARRRSSLS